MGICWTVGTKRSWWNGDDYLLALSRYVHLNPVRVGGIEEKPISEQIKRLREYPWGTYLSYIGRRKAFDFVEYAPILAEMSGKRRGRSKRYREFVETGLAKSDDDFKAAMKLSPRSIGSDGFRTWVDKLYQEMIERHGCPEDAAFRRITEPLCTGVRAIDAMLIRCLAFWPKCSKFRSRSIIIVAVTRYYVA